MRRSVTAFVVALVAVLAALSAANALSGYTWLPALLKSDKGTALRDAIRSHVDGHRGDAAELAILGRAQEDGTRFLVQSGLDRLWTIKTTADHTAVVAGESTFVPLKTLPHETFARSFDRAAHLAQAVADGLVATLAHE